MGPGRAPGAPHVGDLVDAERPCSPIPAIRGHFPAVSVQFTSVNGRLNVTLSRGMHFGASCTQIRLEYRTLGHHDPTFRPSGDPSVIDQHRGVVRVSSEGDPVERLAGVRAGDLRAVDGQRPRNHGAPIKVPYFPICPDAFPRLRR